MKIRFLSAAVAASSLTLALTAAAPDPTTSKTASIAGGGDDPYLWLEDISGDKALNWVRTQNAVSKRELESQPDFEATRKRLLAILDSKEKIPYVSKHGAWYYNFWRDEKNVRGLWRRTTLAEFKKAQPSWETVLDLDQLAAAEKENWVWKGYDVLYPKYDRCLMSLSRGGSDATVTREFDLKSKTFITNGFYLPEAKSHVSWRNRDTLYVGTDFGPGSLTSSGYPRIVKEWKRGQPLSEATLVFEGKTEDVSVDAGVGHDHGHTYEFISRSPTFFTDEVSVRQGNKWVRIEKQDDAQVSTFDDQLLLRVRSDWKVAGKTFPAGSLLSANFKAYLKGDRNMTVLFAPTERKSLQSHSETLNYIILNELDNVRGRVTVLRRNKGNWVATAMPVPEFGSVSVSGIDADESDDYFLSFSDFLTPSTLSYGTIGTKSPEKLKSLPAYFNVEGLEITQHEATSKDGTKVPYFQVSQKGLDQDGNNPTLLYGYGGFQISMVADYRGSIGAAWLERGGVYVLANIRGGGEFGPKWHEAARKENRQRAYDDFAAVAEDLIARKVTSRQTSRNSRRNQTAVC